ncbi:transglycosylase [Nostoc sp. 3335mG]|nr:transglycosylase [Nostoc sp. 3335mG]
MRAMRLWPCGGILALGLITWAAPAVARTETPSIDCGTGISDARFSAAMEMCGTSPIARMVPATAAPADTPAPVSIAMPGTRRQLARAEQAVMRASSSAGPSDGLIAQVGQRYGVDPKLLAAMVRTESGGRQSAVSNKGALGLMQVMPQTARSLGVANPSAMLVDPELALSTGAAYLKTLQARLGNNVALVVAAYNAGPGAVMKAGMRVPAYRETQGYVGQVMGRYAGSYGAP